MFLFLEIIDFPMNVKIHGYELQPWPRMWMQFEEINK
jgi:hypothetical protein